MKTLVLIPTSNERENLPPLVAGALSWRIVLESVFTRWRLIVADGGVRRRRSEEYNPKGSAP